MCDNKEAARLLEHRWIAPTFHPSEELWVTGKPSGDVLHVHCPQCGPARADFAVALEAGTARWFDSRTAEVWHIADLCDGDEPPAADESGTTATTPDDPAAAAARVRIAASCVPSHAIQATVPIKQTPAEEQETAAPVANHTRAFLTVDRRARGTLWIPTPVVFVHIWFFQAQRFFFFFFFFFFFC
jgi:hypothetical protein